MGIRTAEGNSSLIHPRTLASTGQNTDKRPAERLDRRQIETLENKKSLPYTEASSLALNWSRNGLDNDQFPY